MTVIFLCRIVTTGVSAVKMRQGYVIGLRKQVNRMSNQEAIALLRNLEDSLDSYCELNEEGKTAFRMAIEALSGSEIPNSSDTISRQAAINTFYKHPNIKYTTLDVLAILKALPAAHPQQMRGRWIEEEDYNGDTIYECSECGNEFVLIDGTPKDNNYFFCPSCGARMDRGEQNEID